MQTLAWLRRQGFKPVPLHYAQKAAISKDYSSSAAYVPPTDEFWRTRQLGVGVVTGPVATGPVDIDLDCSEALFFAVKFLPTTRAVFGRNTKPRSHYLYRVSSDSFDKQSFIDPMTKTTIVECRGDGGHQTVMPGSVHQDTGESIEWSEMPFPDVPTVPAEILIPAVRKIAIATLISRYMWGPGLHNNPTLFLTGTFYYLNWTEDEAIEMLQAVIDYSGDFDKSRIPSARGAYRRGAAGKKVAGQGKLRELIKNDLVVDKLLEWAGSPTVNMLLQYDERYAAVRIGNKFRIADGLVRPGSPPVFYQEQDFLAFTRPDRIEIDGKLIPKAKIWLSNPRHRSYDFIDFLPGVEDSGDVYNLWTGWAVQPQEGDCSAWLELLHTVIAGDEEEAKWLINWLAGIFQDPLNKPMTAPSIIGTQGAGKTITFDYFGRILGEGYVPVTNPEHVYGKFNQHLSNTLLLHSDEALHGAEKKHRSVLKSLITDNWMMMELKGVNAQRVKNCLRIVLTSNEDVAAPAEFGDRRFTMIDMRKGDRKASRALIDRVLKERDAGGPAALHHHLRHNVQYDPILASTNIKNEALSEMKMMTADPMQEWWLEVLHSGQLLPDMLKWASIPENEDWPEIVATRALYVAMTLNRRLFLGDVSFSMRLSKLIGTNYVKQKRSFNNVFVGDSNVPEIVRNMPNRQVAITNFPSLAQCRESFERVMGQRIKWADDLPENERGLHEKY